MIQLRHQRVGTISLVQHNLNPRVDLYTTGACIEETISGYPQHMLTHPINITNNKRTNQVMHEGAGGSEPAGVPTHRVGDETSGDAHVPDHNGSSTRITLELGSLSITCCHRSSHRIMLPACRADHSVLVGRPRRLRLCRATFVSQGIRVV